MMSQIVSFVVSFLLFNQLLWADSQIQAQSFTELLNSSQAVDASSYQKLKADLWEKFVKQAQNLNELKRQHAQRSYEFNGKSMRFSLDVIGEKPAQGYPLYIALHGGGGAPAYVNDSQWQHMKIYYKDSVKQGVYVAPRGVTDTWNLHFVDESYVLYDQMIQSMVLFEKVDPNRVYLVGFSAGGDGVYQIVPKMADRFAAANMSAGHHNWISFQNLYNTPFLIQMGENDRAYNRNRVAAENYLKLNELQAKYAGGYTHDLFLHLNGSHNSWRDNDASRREAPVILDAQKWLEKNDRQTKNVNSNAVDWLSRFTRVSLPKKIVWDLKTSAYRKVGVGATFVEDQKSLALPHQLFYWLDITSNDQLPEESKIVAQINTERNSIEVLEVKGVQQFKVLLNPLMLDLERPIEVVVLGQSQGTILAESKLALMTKTLLERSDENFIFSAEIKLSFDKEKNTWEIDQ